MRLHLPEDMESQRLALLGHTFAIPEGTSTITESEGYAKMTKQETPFLPRICSKALLDCFVPLHWGRGGSNPSVRVLSDAVACLSRFLLTCALLMTSSDSQVDPYPKLVERMGSEQDQSDTGDDSIFSHQV